jgi:hypothetical protein
MRVEQLGELRRPLCNVVIAGFGRSLGGKQLLDDLDVVPIRRLGSRDR